MTFSGYRPMNECLSVQELFIEGIINSMLNHMMLYCRCYESPAVHVPRPCTALTLPNQGALCILIILTLWVSWRSRIAIWCCGICHLLWAQLQAKCLLKATSATSTDVRHVILEQIGLSFGTFDEFVANSSITVNILSRGRILEAPFKT